MASRDEMNSALKGIVVPRLREMGFKGSLPHLRRERDGTFDLMTFQFKSHGGSLVVEVARCHAEGITTPWGKHIPAKKACAWDRHPLYRKRLPPLLNGKDQWFVFAEQDADSVAETIWKLLSDSSIWDDISPEGDEAPCKKQRSQ